MARSSDIADRPASFDELYGAYGARIFRFCRRLCANSADAEDLTQEVFVAAFRGLPRFAGRASLTTWLYQIALNRYRSTRAKRRVDTVSLDQDELLAPAGDPSEVSTDEIAMQQAMSQLPVIQREAFLLVKGEGLTCREAALALGVPEGTVKFRVYQAIQKLQAALSEGAVSNEAGGAR
jgi:RNA polymerase sigma-70 factor (ECF subfamily)